MMGKSDPVRRGQRIGQIDCLRGLAVGLMIVHHLCFDLSYIYGYDLGLGRGFFYPLHLAIVSLFIISSAWAAGTRPRQSKRGMLRQIGAAGLLFALSFGASFLAKDDLYIFWNMLMVLAVGRLILYLARQCQPYLLVVWLLTGLTYLLRSLAYWFYAKLGLDQEFVWPGQLDYLSLWPWLLLFIAVYSLTYIWLQKAGVGKAGQAQSDCKQRSGLFLCRPLGWLGQRALLIYFIHQPLILLGIEGFHRVKNYLSA